MNVYDFDNTIYAGDSSIDFYLFCIKRHPSLIRCMPRQIVAAINYKLGKIDKVRFKEIYFSFLSKLDDPNKEVVLFWDNSETRIKSWYIDQQKESDLIISASPRFLLAEICKRINIKYLIATEVDASSGQFKSNNCYGIEKVRRFREIYLQDRIQAFYSLVEKLNSGWSGGQAEVSFAKRHPEVTLVNISAALDLAPTVTYNNHALPMCRIGQR